MANDQRRRNKQIRRNGLANVTIFTEDPCSFGYITQTFPCFIHCWFWMDLLRFLKKEGPLLATHFMVAPLWDHRNRFSDVFGLKS